ncbi:MAG: hypothetical protein V3V31_12950 [Methylococcales bacterium]
MGILERERYKVPDYRSTFSPTARFGPASQGSVEEREEKHLPASLVFLQTL